MSSVTRAHLQQLVARRWCEVTAVIRGSTSSSSQGSTGALGIRTSEMEIGDLTQ